MAQIWWQRRIVDNQKPNSDPKAPSHADQIRSQICEIPNWHANRVELAPNHMFQQALKFSRLYATSRFAPKLCEIIAFNENGA
ncbi:hypothetical protein [Mesorhizobium sp. M0036]|uniref:hypothetical protein n=1 Tax=Mesorhizobium sp. M0036 TaxID=2956853 RepID=UPI00333D07E2